MPLRFRTIHVAAVAVVLALCLPPAPFRAQTADETQIEVRRSITVHFRRQDASPAFAALKKADGDVMLQRAGNLLWENAAEGLYLSAGDAVRTKSGATAVIVFPDGSYVKLLPLTQVTLDSITSAEGVRSSVVGLDQGKAWARTTVEKEDEQFVFRAGQAVISGKRASAFLEVNDRQEICLDIFQGTAVLRSGNAPETLIAVNAHQRVKVPPDKATPPPVPMNDQPDESQTKRSCMQAGPATTEQPGGTMVAFIATETEEGEVEYEIIGNTTVSFIGAGETAAAPTEITGRDGTLLFTAEESATLTTTATGEQPAAAPTEETIIEITRNVSMSFVKPAAPPPACSGAPEISGVTVSGGSVSAAGAVTLASTTKCGAAARPAVHWSAKPKCGNITTMTLSVAGAATSLTGGKTGEAVAGDYSFDVADAAPRDIVIKALDSNGGETQFAFKIAVAAGEKPLPKVSKATVNGNTADAGATVNISTDACGAAALTLAGEAGSECGAIQTVALNVNGKPLDVRGASAWSASTTSDKTQTLPVTVQAKDSAGAQSGVFSFDIAFTKTVAPPTVTIESVAGTAVSAFSGKIDVFRTALTDGKLVVTGSAGSSRCRVTKVESSNNNGAAWAAAENTNPWTWRFTPGDGTYEILARSTDEDGNLSADMFRAVEVEYHSKTDEDNLREIFARMIRAYQDKDTLTFIDNTASGYTSRYDSIEDRNRLQLSLDNKFTANPTIYLRHQINSVIVTGASGRVTFQWDADPSTGGYANTGTFLYSKDTGAWKFLTVEDDRTFLRYTSTVASLVLSASKPALIADKTDTALLTAQLRDSANNPVKDGTVVQFSANTGTIPASASTTNGTLTITYTAGADPVVATLIATSGTISASINLTLHPERAPMPPPGP